MHIMDMDGVGEKSDNLKCELRQLSKRQQKKLEKRKIWELNKPAKRQHERARKKQRKAEAQKLGIPRQGPSRSTLKQSSMKNSSCHIRVAIDVGFDHLMIESDIRKMCKQIQRCYALNRRMAAPLQFYVVNLKGMTRDVLQKNNGYESWDIHFRTSSYLEEFTTNEIVYLTSESTNALEVLEETKVYIIGGLVDHNKYKGLCLSLAKKNGIQHARLPIEEHINMQTRKVIAINHVFQILALKTEGASWREALLNTLAQRKGATAKVLSDDIIGQQQNDSNEIQIVDLKKCDKKTEGSTDMQTDEQNDERFIKCSETLDVT